MFHAVTWPSGNCPNVADPIFDFLPVFFEVEIPISDSHLNTSSMGNPLTHVHNHQFSVFKGELSMVKSQFLPIKIH